MPTSPATTPGTGTSQQEQLTPLYHVVLLDDDDHTYEYVVEMLGALFFLSPDSAFQKAVEVDTTGPTSVMTCDRKHAELGRDQIHADGADPRMARSPGSMSAMIEPAN